jgi:asparagine synthetase B (glutamine-hydrolysing)
MFKAIRPAVSAIDYRWTADDGRGGVGVVHPQNVGKPSRWAEDAASGVICVFDGIVYTDAEGNETDTSSTSGADVLLDGYLRLGTECLGAISGSFNVAWWDSRHNRLVVGNDKLGQRLLFYAVQGGKLAFSSLLAGVIAADVISPMVDVGMTSAG